MVEKKTVIDEREIVANKAALLQYLADSSVYKDASGNSPGRHSPESQFPFSTDFEDIRELERIKPELQEYY